MNRPSQCAKCRSAEIVADAKVIDSADYSTEKDLSVAAFRSPEAFIFKGKVTTTVSAWVCASCGYIELYADDPAGLRVQPR